MLNKGKIEPMLNISKNADIKLNPKKNKKFQLILNS